MSPELGRRVRVEVFGFRGGGFRVERGEGLGRLLRRLGSDEGFEHSSKQAEAAFKEFSNEPSLNPNP